MHIFIDESGTFALSEKPSSVSAVGALVIPSYQMPGFEKLYGRVRRTLPKHNGEVKGKLLSEDQVVEVAEVVRKVGGVFEVLLMDMGLHTKAGLEAHRAGQAEAVTANLTDLHHPNLKTNVWALRRELEDMSLQLYVQAFAMETLIYHTINHLQTYHAFHNPAELRAYHWVIDAKHRDGEPLAPWEEWWRKAVLPLLESHTFKEPFMMVEGGDYSGLSRYETTVSEWKQQFIKPSAREGHFDLKLLMTEDFRFSSASEPGLEVVDILVNTMRRSVSGNFSRDGWMALPQLMINRKPQCFHFIMLGKDEVPDRPLPYRAVLRDFKQGGRIMLPRS